MSDECTCEKCQADSLGERESSVRVVARAEAQAGDSGRSQSNLYLVATDGGLSLR